MGTACAHHLLKVCSRQQCGGDACCRHHCVVSAVGMHALGIADSSTCCRPKQTAMPCLFPKTHLPNAASCVCCPTLLQLVAAGARSLVVTAPCWLPRSLPSLW